MGRFRIQFPNLPISKHLRGIVGLPGTQIPGSPRFSTCLGGLRGFGAWIPGFERHRSRSTNGAGGSGLFPPGVKRCEGGEKMNSFRGTFAMGLKSQSDEFPEKSQLNKL